MKKARASGLRALGSTKVSGSVCARGWVLRKPGGSRRCSGLVRVVDEGGAVLVADVLGEEADLVG